MPTAEQLQQLAAWLAGTDIGLLELRTPNGCVRLGRNGAPAGEIVPPGEPDAPAMATAPCVGVFLHGHPLHDAPVVRIGEHVAAGQDLGLLRIGPLLLPVRASRAGQVTALRVDAGRTVDYGTALVELRAD
jgi:acetyl-CoA carboxylase biotin carboxyl carrier protein